MEIEKPQIEIVQLVGKTRADEMILLIFIKSKQIKSNPLVRFGWHEEEMGVREREREEGERWLTFDDWKVNVEQGVMKS